MAAPVYEPYGYSDIHGQPEPSAFWGVPQQVQHASPGQLGAPNQAHQPWDPAEELAILLQEGAALGQPEPFTPKPFDGIGDTAATLGFVAGLEHNPGERPSTQATGGHRRNQSKRPVMTLLQTGSLFTAVLVAVIAAVVSILSGLAICDALRHSAAPHTAREVVIWWPLLIYGPWMVASLSILRSALHQRRALHSWSIVLLFSTLATLLCVAQAPRTIAAAAASALPAVAALACFQQLVRQITLTRPPRQAIPRHRNPAPSAPTQLRQTAAAGHNPVGVPAGCLPADNRAARSPSQSHPLG
ncbi:hypothetical protein OHA84_35810 [Streptomyces sp. NBC_00513]|uniref:hypothetical protein n=1 Tax=unclassified Streptomyces TaxID=2593676 RepID=UPI002253BF2F|nr:hypothetical protein [Streptomyces sp. NBC_00424]MCX5071127.1 hypothetical protein [Streptomyces sp. NBC_00424]WUD45452.1 hypothetical protein OHA84_35810 [Streptomyces sp. NBC_00513]